MSTAAAARKAHTMVIVTVATIALLGVGCSFVVATDGLSGGTAPDSGTMTGDASTDGGPLSNGDSSTTTDGGPTSPNGRFCDRLNPAPFLCEDFDGPLTLEAAAWRKTGAGTTSVDDSVSLSAPRALIAVTPLIPNGKTSGAAISHDVELGDHIRATWSMRQELPSCDGGNTGLLSFIGNNQFFITQIQLEGASTLNFQEYGQPGFNGDAEYSNVSPIPGSIVTSDWVRVSMDVNLKSPLGFPVASVTINDAPQPTLQNVKLLTTITPQKIIFDIGFTYVGGPSDGCRGRFDNVTVEKL